MERMVKQWKACNPFEMSLMSEAAIAYALQDAKKDILKMAEALRVIGYPCRGTEEESMDLDAIAKYVQANFSLDELSES